MQQNDKSTMDLFYVDDQKIKSLGLKKTVAYVPLEPKRKQSSPRHARYREKQRMLVKTIRDVGQPSDFVLSYVKESGWGQVESCILITSKVKRMPFMIRWLLKLL